MLYVLGLIALPSGNWQIWRVVEQGPDLEGENATAKADMVQWLRKLAATKIPKHLELVRRMLERNPKQRIEAQVLVDDVALQRVEEEVEKTGWLQIAT